MQYPGAGPVPNVKGCQKSSKSLNRVGASNLVEDTDPNPAVETSSTRPFWVQKEKRTFSAKSAAFGSKAIAAVQNSRMNSTPRPG